MHHVKENHVPQRTVPEGHTVEIDHLRYAKGAHNRRRGVPTKFDSPVVPEEARPAHELRARGYQLDPIGGMTRVLIRDSDARVVAAGVAHCAVPDRTRNVPGDNFNRRLGRTIALGRALKELETGSRA